MRTSASPVTGDAAIGPQRLPLLRSAVPTRITAQEDA